MKQTRWNLILALCLVYATGQAQLTYKDVAPVFLRRCADCHHQGKVFPSLTHYGSVSLYKGIIAANLQSGKMPPWYADTTYMRFSHERIITLSEKTQILNWLAAGGPPGDTTLAPPVPLYSRYQLGGTPDLVLSSQKYVSTASYTDKNVCFALPTGLTQDRVLRAYEIVPGNSHLAHHIIMAIDTLGTSVSDLSGSCNATSYGSVTGGWTPGSSPVVFPSKNPLKLGITIKKGSHIVLQVHYPAGTSSLSDSIQLRLYFYPLNTPGIRDLSFFIIKDMNFGIAANGTATVTGIYPRTGSLQQDISVFSIFPHSHKICTSIKNYASQGAVKIPLCRIRNWNFEWQDSYVFKTLQKIPMGSRLYGQHVYDNTSNNPNHSPLPVNAGFGSDDEMLFDMLLCTTYMPGDETINVDSILGSDELLSALAEEASVHAAPAVTAYPNPFHDRITISCELPAKGQLDLTVYDMVGRRIKDLCSKTEPAGIHTYEWDGTTDQGEAVSPGLYLYKLSTASITYCGKILLAPKER